MSFGGGPRNWVGPLFAFAGKKDLVVPFETTFQRPSTRDTSGVNVRRTRSTLRPHCGTSSVVDESE